MRRFLLLTQSPMLAASLRVWLTSEKAGGQPMAEAESVAIEVCSSAPGSDTIVREFHRLADRIEEHLERALGYLGLPDLIVITDLAGDSGASPADLIPMAQDGWKTVAGMLILAFPEVRWMLLAAAPGEALVPAWSSAHLARSPEDIRRLLASHDAGYCPLFDASGFRDAIRSHFPEVGEDPGGGRAPLRAALAAAIDDEPDYAYLHAYTAYRFGYRAHAIISYRAMREFLQDQPELVFEDVFLNFSDHKPPDFSNLQVRDATWSEGTQPFKPLAQARYRIVVTLGHEHGQSESARTNNPAYLRLLRDGGQWNRVIQKPLAGIFNLWNASGLQDRLKEGGRPGLAPGYQWPRHTGLGAHPSAGGGHSPPERIGDIAQRLIVRARRLSADADSVPTTVRCAVLATDALELLDSNMTLSGEALELKQSLEAAIECRFVGMQEHVDIASRLHDVRREVQATGFWAGRTKRERQAAQWNAELSILNRLIEIFHEHNQFDEEQGFQARARTLHRKLYLNDRWWLKAFEPVLWYTEQLLASLTAFVFALVGWIVTFGFLYAWAGHISVSLGMIVSFRSFLTWSTPDNPKIWNPGDGWNLAFWLIAIASVSAFAHLGIFIASLYSNLTRK